MMQCDICGQQGAKIRHITYDKALEVKPDYHAARLSITHLTVT
ncbi:MAG: hypothetical protein ACRDEA_22515 [Microcystaceae cyanobacterium]